jgi:hypothetical protein
MLTPVVLQKTLFYPEVGVKESRKIMCVGVKMVKISKEQKQFLKALRIPKQVADQKGGVSLQSVTVVRRGEDD